MLGHHIAVIRGIWPTWGLTETADLKESRNTNMPNYFVEIVRMERLLEEACCITKLTTLVSLIKNGNTVTQLVDSVPFK